MRFLHEDMKIFDSETLAIIRLFEEMNGQNPFTSKPCIEIQQLDNPENEDNINNEGEIIEKNYDEGPCEDEEFILCMHEIPIKYRADVILFLCYLKADSEEFTKHIKRIEEDENKQRSSIKNKQSSNRKSGNEKLSGDNESKSNNKSESEEEEVGMLDTEPILLGKDSKKNTYIFFEQHKDCRVYMQNEDFSEFSLVCNSPEELKMLISKLTIEDESTIKLEKERKEKAEEGKTVNKRKTRQKQAENNISNKSSLPLNAELIKSLESLTDLFVKNNEEWNKRQMILARKLQTLERSRSLLTKQRTRRQEKELDYSLFQGRMTRGGLKTLKKNLGEDNQEDASNRSCPSNNETNKIQQIAEELRKKERQETEKIAREERLQK